MASFQQMCDLATEIVEGREPDGTRLAELVLQECEELPKPTYDPGKVKVTFGEATLTGFASGELFAINSAGERVPSPPADPGYWEWLQTYTGGKFYARQPTVESINILDVAHGGALENRYGGQTEEPYSVNQHEVLVAKILRDVLGRPDLEFEGLMHDTPEGLGLKDLPRPVKVGLPEYTERYEHPVMQVIAKKYMLTYPFPPEVKVADNIALMTERRDLFRFRSPDWRQTLEPLPERIWPADWRVAEQIWLDRFYILWAERQKRGPK